MSTITTIAESPSRVATRILLTGRVQGIGLRPAVARFAQQLSLAGHVGNTQNGVEIHVEGAAEAVAKFGRALLVNLPASAEITSAHRVSIEPSGCTAFVVGNLPRLGTQETEAGSLVTCPPLATRVPPDVVVCERCMAEVREAGDRRSGYPFTSCTDCGPRYTIVDRMSYERGQTSMSSFPMCERCRSEYESPADRRMHAQTNACPDCGPKIWLRDADDRVAGRGPDALRAAAYVLREGRVVSLRGLGGYQLLADATSQQAVERLRQRKQRCGKPLAVMVESLEVARRLAHLDTAECDLLVSPAGPIVIAEARSDLRLASSVASGMNTIGVMLPTTPLHALLLEAVHRPLVCTSANVEGEPLVYEMESAFNDLRAVADVWLEHDRLIRRPIDDSVVRVIAGRATMIRLARGYAPLPLPVESEPPIVALGGHQKTSLALCNGGQAVLGPHIGDLDTLPARQRFVEQLADLSALYGIERPQLVCDWHPEYFTTRWAEQQTCDIVPIQHHHAHVVAGMLEHGWLDRQVLGVAFDGTGYGTDGTVWGGEMLLATATGFERAGHLRPFPLPGGERAVREPWRVATALVRDAVGADAAARLVFQTGDAKSLQPVLRSRRLSPTTTSAGRLFDGVAAIVCGIEQCEFEGQAAMYLESACDLSAHGAYHMTITDGQTKQLDWRPLVRQILHDQAAGVTPGTMAMRFHRALADAILRFSREYSALPVVLGGGVFQNRILTELLIERFAKAGQLLGQPGMIPPNDGGLAAGQLAVAAALAQQRRTVSCA